MLLWIFGVGGAGFSAGFFGPMIFTPEANQGPLVGIFLSGPAGFCLGLCLGVACRLLRVPAVGQWRTLWVSCVAAALVTLYFVMPEPALRGYAFDTQIQGCESPVQAADAAIKYWEDRIARAPWAQARRGWQDEERRILQDARGVILNVVVLRKNRIYEARKPWNKGQMIASGWKTSNEQTSYYARYAGGSCADYPVGTRSVHFSEYDVSVLNRSGPSDWPPRGPATFLNRQTLDPVPDQYRKLLNE
jgi:hypothetical protein